MAYEILFPNIRKSGMVFIFILRIMTANGTLIETWSMLLNKP